MMSEKDFEILFKSRFSSLCNLAYTVVKNADVAKDVVQQVFIKLWNKQENLTIRGPIESYLYRMVINTALNYIEKEKKFTRFEFDSPQTLEQTAESSENIDEIEIREDKIRKAISQLPPQCQTVFSLSRFENLSNKEIAGHLGISVKTVEKHITVAFKSLREKLKSLLNSELDILIIFFILNFLIQQVGILIIHLSS